MISFTPIRRSILLSFSARTKRPAGAARQKFRHPHPETSIFIIEIAFRYAHYRTVADFLKPIIRPKRKNPAHAGQ
jgi:hypothetical protein